MTAPTTCNPWTDEDIAALSSSDIARLNYHQMQDVIAAAEPERSRTGAPHVTESVVLVRLVYSARQRCLQRLANK